MPREDFRLLLENCKKSYGGGFPKKYRLMTTREFCKEVTDYYLELGMIQEEREFIQIRAVVGKIAGRYPEDFSGEGEADEQ